MVPQHDGPGREAVADQIEAVRQDGAAVPGQPAVVAYHHLVGAVDVVGHGDHGPLPHDEGRAALGRVREGVRGEVRRAREPGDPVPRRDAGTVAEAQLLEVPDDVEWADARTGAHRQMADENHTPSDVGGGMDIPPEQLPTQENLQAGRKHDHAKRREQPQATPRWSVGTRWRQQLYPQVATTDVTPWRGESRQRS